MTQHTHIDEPRGIPTLYKRVQFRSRAEARWAAFFDELGWPWEYEPIDLDGYIPDFILPFAHSPLLVEVKHEMVLPDALLEHRQKIMDSTWGGEAVLVGARLARKASGEPLCGLFGARQAIGSELEWCWDDAALFWCVPCRGVSIHELNGSWRCRRCGVDDGNRHVDHIPDSAVRGTWDAAGNDVQWKGPNA